MTLTHVAAQAQTGRQGPHAAVSAPAANPAFLACTHLPILTAAVSCINSLAAHMCPAFPGLVLQSSIPPPRLTPKQAARTPDERTLVTLPGERPEDARGAGTFVLSVPDQVGGARVRVGAAAPSFLPQHPSIAQSNQAYCLKGAYAVLT